MRDLLTLTGIALIARLAVAALIPEPPWTDSAYYFASAREIADGNGLTVPFVWSFLETNGALPPDPQLPIPSHAHWMPLTSFVAAASMALFGTHWWAAQVPMVLVSTALTPLTYLMAMRLWGTRTAASVGSLLVIFAGPLLLFGSIVENYAVFGLAGVSALYAAMHAAGGGPRAAWWLVGSGALVGLATLARIEGVLLSLATATAWLIGMRWSPWQWNRRPIGWLPGIASFLAFCAVVAPWAARNILTFGSILPSTGGHTLWIKSYNEQFSITADTSIQSYVAQGLGPIIGSKIQAWGILSGYVLVLLGVFGLFMLGAFIARRADSRLGPFLVYFVSMLVLMGGLFTFHAPRGLFLHHASAWLPIGAPLGVLGVGVTAAWFGRWWHFLYRPQTHRFLTATALSASIVISVATSASLLRSWHQDVDAMLEAKQFLQAHAELTDVVMHSDAPMLWAITGYRAVAPPQDPYPVIEEVARAYGVRWLVAQQLTHGPAVEPTGLWSGASATDDLGNRATWVSSEPAFETDGLRIFELEMP